MLEVKDRKTAGLIEIEIAKEFSDRTDWRKMLKGELEESNFDLPFLRDQIFETFGDIIDDLDAKDLDEDIIEINYPVLEHPKKVTSLSFDKKSDISGKLLGIKGQYLILSSGVINMRKHQGYFVDFEA